VLLLEGADRRRADPAFIQEESAMRIAFAVLLMLIAVSTVKPVQADPYRYCAEYGGSGEGSSNCYFLTLQQCREAISGVGGFCRENGFYDGRPVSTDGSPSQPRRRKHV
jgi:hypothetical protein